MDKETLQEFIKEDIIEVEETSDFELLQNKKENKELIEQNKLLKEENIKLINLKNITNQEINISKEKHNEYIEQENIKIKENIKLSEKLVKDAKKEFERITDESNKIIEDMKTEVEEQDNVLKNKRNELKSKEILILNEQQKNETLIENSNNILLQLDEKYNKLETIFNKIVEENRKTLSLRNLLVKIVLVYYLVINLLKQINEDNIFKIKLLDNEKIKFEDYKKNIRLEHEQIEKVFKDREYDLDIREGEIGKKEEAIFKRNKDSLDRENSTKADREEFIKEKSSFKR